MSDTPFEILLIEDDSAQALLVKLHLRSDSLQSYPINLNTVRDGLDAQTFLNQSLNRQKPRPDLIILDLNMPRMNGQQFLEWLRQEADFRLRCIPVVVMTTSTNEQEILAAYQQQIATYIPKPLDSRNLLLILESMQKIWVQFSISLPEGDCKRV